MSGDGVSLNSFRLIRFNLLTLLLYVELDQSLFVESPWSLVPGKKSELIMIASPFMNVQQITVRSPPRCFFYVVSPLNPGRNPFRGISPIRMQICRRSCPASLVG
ncbi:hypothetical protein TNCT_659531 [Trichonephila clavata]|uniref:Uncharacterized protein n=1 Tax=Trichonephila clavata TaxID=2740835 RepID=A0A8X6GLE2_TRICU|nr:hypothetical protein TNCT_659531 [Trichonephila clavata]